MATITVVDDERSNLGWAFAFFLLLFMFIYHECERNPYPSDNPPDSSPPQLSICRFQNQAAGHHGKTVKIGPVRAAGNCKPGSTIAWLQHPELGECYVLTYATMPIPTADSTFFVVGVPTLKFIDGRNEWVMTQAKFVDL